VRMLSSERFPGGKPEMRTAMSGHGGGAGARGAAIIQGHPDSGERHLCHALADAYAEGATAAGHAVSRIEVAQLDFPILRTAEDFQRSVLPEALIPARDAIVSARHLVIVFPLWFGTMPALLKAFLEQAMRPGVAFEYRAHGFPRALLSGRSARIVVTMGMPAPIYRWWFGAHGVRGLERNVLRFVGLRPVRETLLGSVGEASETRRGEWLARMKRHGAGLL